VPTKSLETEATLPAPNYASLLLGTGQAGQARGAEGGFCEGNRGKLQPTSYNLRLKLVIGVKYVIIRASE
jgi:hypothetical protein